MAKNRKRGIVIFEGRKGGGSRRTGRLRGSRRLGKFSATFEADEAWETAIDSRDLLAIVGTEIYGHLKRSIRADVDPETGAAHPKTLSTRTTGGLSAKALRAYQASGGRRLGRKTTRDRDVDTHAMANALRRTITDYGWGPARWGGKWQRISLPTSRMKFYFGGADAAEAKRWAGLNKADSTRGGRNRIIWLGIGGNTAKLIRPALARWTDRALEGQKFERDTKQKARRG